MPAPDLPMRERIAEINCDIESSGSVYGVSHWCTTHDMSAIAGQSYCHRGIARADAALALFATPSEAMVERGAKAMFEEERNASMSGTPWPEWEEIGDDFGDVGKEPYREIARAVLTAALVDEKEARG